ncbi:GNAT family N-acetyltransferase [Pseudooceanicola sp. 502str34]
MIETRVLTGEALGAALDDVARLRIAVFRDWPYLYEGDLDYERRYLDVYTTETAVVVAALDAGRVVGVATGMGMEEADADFAAAFAGRTEKAGEVFYCAESVLLPEYRGQGLGHAFFDLREAHARALGRRWSAFCSVVRPSDHPARPEGYRPLDVFWRGRGYAPVEGAVARYHWTDVGAAEQTGKDLQVWMRAL